MPRSARRLVAASLAAVSLVSTGAASVARSEGASDLRVQVTPGCFASLASTIPATSTSCAQTGVEAVPVTSDSVGPDQCSSVVPLIDDRCEEWTARYDGPAGGPDYPTGDLGGSRLVAASPDSSAIFAAGTSDANPSTASGWAGWNLDLAIAAFDATTGAQRWSYRLSGPDQSIAENIVTDPDGDLVFATAQDSSEGADQCKGATTVAVDAATGEQVWVAEELAGADGCLSARTATVDPAGERVFTVGTAVGEDGRAQQVLIARDASTGIELWRSAESFHAPLGANGSAVAVSPDSARVYVGGSEFIADPYGQGYPVSWGIRGYDTQTGERALNISWRLPLADGPSNFPANPPAAMAVSPDGGSLYAVGGVDHLPGRFFDITAVAFDTASGEQRWMYRYDGPRDKSSFDSVWFNGSLALSSDGSRMAIAGYSTHLVGVNLQLDLATILVDTTNGQGLWATRYTAENETNWIPSVALSPDAARVYVAAPSRYAVKWELPSRYTTLAYNATDGSVAWTARHSDGHSFAQGSVLTPDGKRFVVTGMTGDAGAQTVNGVDWGVGLAAYSTT